jgi:CubicO group peptidase (beta-lactamase class C family)
MGATAAVAQPEMPANGDPAIGRAAVAALQKRACPGVSVAIARAGSLVVAGGFGMANVETQTPVSERTIFRIGSLTKQFTAAATIKLAAMGRLDLKAPAATYLPSMRPLKPFTLLELMNHTAGLHSDEGDGANPPSGSVKTQVQLAEEISRQAKPFDFEPGTAWLYSNANYIVLGAVIEAVARAPLASALSDLVFSPLHLDSVAMDRSGEVVVGRASGYTPTNDSSRPFENAAYIEIAEAGGAGALRASAIDLCRWHDALLGEKLFDRAHLDLMLSPGRLRDGRLSSSNRFSADDAHYGDVEYACGLLISGPSEPHPSVLHYGGINGFAAVLQTYRDRRVTFAVLCNGDTGPNLPFRDIRQAVISQFL